MKTIHFDPDNNELVNAIKRIPAFAPLPDDLLKDVMTMASIREYDRREDVITQGEQDRCMFFLMHGKLSVRVNDTEVNTLGKTNTVFGEMGIIDNAPRSASVVARRESRCLALDVSFFDKLEGRSKLAVQAFFYKMFYQILVERLRQANQHIADLDLQRVVMENMDI